MNQEMLIIIVAVLVNGLVDCTLVAWLAGQRSRRALMNLVHEAATGDKEALTFLYEIGDVLIAWASDERIPTGETVKVATDKVDAEGKPIYKEVKEVLSPIQIMARTIGSYVIMKFKGSVGGTKNQMKQMLMEEASETGVGLSPTALNALARGRVGPALAEIGLPFLQQAINKKGVPGSNQQGGGDYLK